MNANDVSVVLALVGGSLDGAIIPLPGIAAEDVREARRHIEAGEVDTPAVQRLATALDRGLGPRDSWSLGDELALRLEASEESGWAE